MKTKPIGFKAFEKGMKCKGVQYAENFEFTHKGNIKICEKGIHYCENPLDTLNYYNLCDSEFAEILEHGDKVDKKDDDSKVCTNRIKIGAKLDLKAFIKASFDFLWEKCKDKDSGDYSKLASSGYSSQLASSGDYSQLASSGYYSKLASSGYYSKLASSGYSSQLASAGDSSQLASSGDSSQLASSGYSSKLASAGDSSKLASSGYYSKLASAGDYSKLASAGDSSQLASSGDYSKLASSGDYSKLASSGENSVCANIGINGKIKASFGTWITLAEYDDNYKCICVKSAKIDGKKLKADTWYILKDKKFTETE
jgi:hypothetical protein